MKRKNIILGSLALIVITFVLVIGGVMIYAKLKPSVKVSVGLGPNVIFRIDDSKCSKAEFSVLLYDNKKMYDELYGVQIWDSQIEDISARDYIKQETLNQLAVYKCVRLLAEEKKVYLSDSQKNEVKAKAKVYIESFNEDEIEQLGISEEGARALFEERMIYDKLFDALTTTVDEEISVDEARVIKIQYIYVPKSENAARAKAEALYERVVAKDSFEKLAIESNGAAGYECLLARGTMEKEFEEAAFELGKDENSELIETQKGFYIIKCINDYEKAATENNKTVILNSRKNEIFKKIYDEYSVKLYYELNETAFNAYEFDGKAKVHVKLSDL